MHCQGKKGSVDKIAGRKAKGNIGNSKTGFAAKLVADSLEGIQGGDSTFRVGADTHSQRVDNDIFCGNSVIGSAGVNFTGNCDAALGSFGNTGFIDCKGNKKAAVFFCQRENLLHNFFLAVYRVYHRFTVI